MIRSRPIASRRRRPAGFTMVELLVVILILAVLAAILLPVINGALRTAKNSAVGAEINQLAQALASFKAKYGEYPPSRIWLAEDGNFSIGTSTTPLAPGDISSAQLAQRSLAALRKFFPNVTFSTAADVFPSNSNRYYDFNGDGVFAYHQPYILQGHECLVFFLGGIPFEDSTGGFSVTGFGKDPRNPFSNSIVGDEMYSNNRSAPLFEFIPGRLALDPNSVQFYAGQYNNWQWNSPGYLDSLGNSLSSGLINFYAYFSAHGGGYDPNDVNFPPLYTNFTAPLPELDVNLAIPRLAFRVSFPIVPPAITGVPSTAGSPAPNPYTSSLSVPASGAATFYNPQTFQIISAGVDGQYGVGGQYTPDSGSPIVLDNNAAVYMNSTTDTSIRTRERDNITNFHNGRLD